MVHELDKFWFVVTFKKWSKSPRPTVKGTDWEVISARAVGVWLPIDLKIPFHSQNKLCSFTWELDLLSLRDKRTLAQKRLLNFLVLNFRRHTETHDVKSCSSERGEQTGFALHFVSPLGTLGYHVTVSSNKIVRSNVWREVVFLEGPVFKLRSRVLPFDNQTLRFSAKS